MHRAIPRMLSQTGAIVFCASTVDGALAYLQGNAMVDILVTSRRVSDEICTRLLRYAQQHRLPCVIATSNPEEVTQHERRFATVLNKPFGVAELLAAVEAAPEQWAPAVCPACSGRGWLAGVPDDAKQRCRCHGAGTLPFGARWWPVPGDVFVGLNGLERTVECCRTRLGEAIFTSGEVASGAQLTFRPALYGDAAFRFVRPALADGSRPVPAENALPPASSWSTKAPTMPGWYWLHAAMEGRPPSTGLVRAVGFRGAPGVMFMTEGVIFSLQEVHGAQWILAELPEPGKEMEVERLRMRVVQLEAELAKAKASAALWLADATTP